MMCEHVAIDPGGFCWKCLDTGFQLLAEDMAKMQKVMDKISPQPQKGQVMGPQKRNPEEK